MPETKIEELLIKLRRGLEHLYGERLAGIYLFGSYARTEATPESDVDILIVLDEVTDYGREIEHTGHLVSELSLDYDVSISRVFVSSSAWLHRDSPFLSKVREQAKALEGNRGITARPLRTRISQGRSSGNCAGSVMTSWRSVGPRGLLSLAP